jgi:glycosyltransferase involved in cell wall biosynthesis
MHILFLSDNFPPETNAPATRLYEHAVHWVAAGHQVTVITCAPNFPSGVIFPGYRNRWYVREQMNGIRVVRVKTYITSNEGFLKRTLDYVSFMFSGVIAGLFQRRPDIIVATSPQFFAALGAWLLAALRRKPFVFELRDLWPASIVAVGAMRDSWIIRRLEQLELFLYRRASRIVSVTEAFKQDLIGRGISADKIDVVINGADLQHYSPRAKDSELLERYDLQQQFVVGYLGTSGMAHALERVLEAAAILQNAGNSHIVFLFVGGGASWEKLQNELQRQQLGNVRMVPNQPKAMMPRFWSVCDLALIHLRDTPVFSTVIPSKLFEAMAMGLPVLMSLPQGEATDLVERLQTGVVIPPEQPQVLAQTVLELSRQPQRIAQLRQTSRTQAEQFSRSRQAAKMLDSLQTAAPAGGLAPSSNHDHDSYT